MSKFVLTAQLQLQAPGNVKQIVQQIQSQLNGVNVNIQVQNAGQAQKQLQQVAQATNQATSAADRMGKAFALSIRRFAAFSIATRAVGLFTSTLSDAVQTAINFERELIKVSQVTGKSISQLRGLTKEITSLSTGLGVSSNDLLNVTTVLAQAGLSAEDTTIALRTLAKAALAPNFDSISETAEGAIAILAQFQQGVGALEGQLGSINAVAGAFAVEAGDLIDVIRRTGGVFKASGGDLNELLALFTSIRATTRESAESIGTGLRTILTRIQRPKTIEYLKQFGVELVDLNGKFIGPYEAVKQLSAALAGLGEGDLTFISIAEELGGFRQIGKVLPLLQQFSTAQAALNVAMKAGDSLTQDAASAQAALAIRIMKVKEEFLALIRSVTETSTFQIMANTALSLASALIKIADSIKPLLPMLAALAAFKLVKGMGSFFGGMMSGATSGRAYNSGGKVHRFASGGLVPGSGNRDTVPAMLSPGEFVIRKSSVNKMGAGTLAAMNSNRYAYGGKARTFGIAALDGTQDSKSSNLPISAIREKLGINTDKVSSKDLDMVIRGILGSKGSSNLSVTAKSDTVTLNDPGIKDAIYNNIKSQMYGLITSSATALSTGTGIPMRKRAINPNKVLAKVGTDSTIGSVFEGALGLLGGPFSAGKSTAAIDYPRGLGKMASAFSSLSDMPVDAKKTADSKKTSEMLNKKIPNFFAEFVKRSPQYTSFKTRLSQGKLDKLKGREFDLDDYKRVTGNAKANTGDLSQIANFSRKSGNRQFFMLKNLGGLIQKFAGGGMAETPNLIKRGTLSYRLEDILKAGLTPAQFLEKIPVPPPLMAINPKPGEYGTQFKIGGIGSGSVPMPKFLTPYAPPDSAAYESSQDAVLKKSEASAEYRRKKGLTSRDYEGKSSTEKSFLSAKRRGYAAGGGVGTDTVPALLTPGEFVINRQSAQGIGYGNLNRMNKVGKYANGGVVKHFATGGKATGGGSNDTGKGFDSLTNGLFGLSMVLSMVTPQIDEKSSTLVRVISNLMGTFTTMIATLAAVQMSLASFGMQLNAKNIGEGLSKLKNIFSGGKGGLADMFAGVQKTSVGTGRRGGQSISESFQNARKSSNVDRTIGRVRADAAQLPIKDRLGPIDPMQQNAREMYAQRLRSLRQTKTNIPAADSLTGRLGSRLGQLSTRGGFVGRAAATTARVASRIGGTSAAQGAMSLLPSFAKLLPIIGGVTTAFTLLKSATDAVASAYGQEKNNQIKAGNVEKAGEAARNEAAFSGGGAGAAIGGVIGGVVGSFFGPVLGTAIGATAGASLGAALSDPFGNLEKEAVSLAQAQAGEVRASKTLETANTEAARAMIDFKNGTKSATDVLNSYTAAAQEQQLQQARTDETVNDRVEGKSRGVSRLGRNILARAGGGLFGMETAGTRNKRLTEEGTASIRSRRESSAKFFSDTAEARNNAIRSSFFKGSSREEAENTLSSRGFDTVKSLQSKAVDLRKQEKTAFEGGDLKMAQELGLSATDLENRAKDLEQAFVNIEKEVKSAKEKFAALNLGFRSITSASDAAALKMDNLMSSFEAGNLPAARAAATLEAAMTSAGQNINKVDFDSALNEVNGAFKAFGASEKQINDFNGLLRGVAGVQKEFPSIFEELKTSLSNGELRDIGNPQAVGNKFKEIVGAQLKASRIDEAVKEKILAAMGNVQLDEVAVNKILSGDYSVLEEKLGDAAEEVKKNMKAVVDNYIKINQQLIEATKQRIESERNLVEAQKEALDLMMEGREVQAKYGGREVTNQERRQNVLAKSNVEGSRLGLSNMRTGDAPELRRRNLEIMGGFANVEDGRRRNGLQGVRGAEANEFQKDLEKTYKTQIDTIRSLIKLEEDQLKIIEEKNKLEKESLESLAKGDIESFFKQQAAVGARAAIASGDQRSMNLYGSEALGAAASDIQRQKDAGVQSLYGQRLGGAGGLAEAASSAALSSMGVTDMRSAQIMAGTTGEEEASKSRLRELGGLLGETGQIGVQMAEMQVGTATINAEKAELIVTNLATGGNAPQNRASGGLIYASRGMFVPRGSDTVPAMLTPGEFVVSRAAVQRGNNLQILSAMNGGSSSSSSSSTQSESVQMSRGGVVKYFDKGGRAEANESSPMGSFDNQIMNKFAESLSSFNRNLTANIDKLKQTSINIKLDSTNVNVNLNDGGLLKALEEKVKKELLTVISNQFKLDNNGNIRRNQSVLG